MAEALFESVCWNLKVFNAFGLFFTRANLGLSSAPAASYLVAWLRTLALFFPARVSFLTALLTRSHLLLLPPTLLPRPLPSPTSQLRGNVLSSHPSSNHSLPFAGIRRASSHRTPCPPPRPQRLKPHHRTPLSRVLRSSSSQLNRLQRRPLPRRLEPEIPGARDHSQSSQQPVRLPLPLCAERADRGTQVRLPLARILPPHSRPRPTNLLRPLPLDPTHLSRPPRPPPLPPWKGDCPTSEGD